VPAKDSSVVGWRASGNVDQQRGFAALKVREASQRRVCSRGSVVCEVRGNTAHLLRGEVYDIRRSNKPNPTYFHPRLQY
jgi:hypothetical protein